MSFCHSHDKVKDHLSNQRHLGTRLIGEAGDGFPFAAQSRDLSNSCIPTSRKKSRILGDSTIQQLREISAPWPCCGSLRLCVRSRPTWEVGLSKGLLEGQKISGRHHQFETSLFHIILLSSQKNPNWKLKLTMHQKKEPAGKWNKSVPIPLGEPHLEVASFAKFCASSLASLGKVVGYWVKVEEDETLPDQLSKTVVTSRWEWTRAILWWMSKILVPSCPLVAWENSENPCLATAWEVLKRGKSGHETCTTRTTWKNQRASSLGSLPEESPLASLSCPPSSGWQQSHAWPTWFHTHPDPLRYFSHRIWPAHVGI